MAEMVNKRAGLTSAAGDSCRRRGEYGAEWVGYRGQCLSSFVSGSLDVCRWCQAAVPPDGYRWVRLLNGFLRKTRVRKTAN